MGKKFEQNQVDVNGDGRIVLYIRPESPNKWQCRISVRGSTGYKRFSTGESDQRKAERVALDEYEKLYFKVQKGGSVKGKPFSKVYEEWKEHYLATATTSSQHRDTLVRYAKSCGLEYFKNKPIDEITEANLMDMMTWATSKIVPYGKQVSAQTLRQRGLAVTYILRFAKQRGYIQEVQPIKLPNIVPNPRPDFTKQEWKKLTTFMREWVKTPAKYSLSNIKSTRGKSGTIDKKLYRERFYFQQYVLVMGNTGCRIGEMRKVRWLDLDKTVISQGDERLLFTVSGKTGRRTVVANAGVERYIRNIWEFRKNELGIEDDNKMDKTEYIFCHPSGKYVQYYRFIFNSLMRDSGLEFDVDGNRRTIYSFRHTYATFRVNEVPVYQLAVNMGTSVEMIEKFYGHARSKDPKFAETVTKGNQASTGYALPF
tara:strand:+ start:9135 stop:10412 length:1278 start_codon:yes stop_codon:yes gene_type:complete